MCEAKVYISKAGKEQSIMEDVVLLQSEGNTYVLVSLLGRQMMIRGRIEKIDFLRHTVHLSQWPEDRTES